jgi:hypothetical protein
MSDKPTDRKELILQAFGMGEGGSRPAVYETVYSALTKAPTTNSVVGKKHDVVGKQTIVLADLQGAGKVGKVTLNLKNQTTVQQLYIHSKKPLNHFVCMASHTIHEGMPTNEHPDIFVVRELKPPSITAENEQNKGQPLHKRLSFGAEQCTGATNQDYPSLIHTLDGGQPFNVYGVDLAIIDGLAFDALGQNEGNHVPLIGKQPHTIALALPATSRDVPVLAPESIVQNLVRDAVKALFEDNGKPENLGSSIFQSDTAKNAYWKNYVFTALMAWMTHNTTVGNAAYPMYLYIKVSLFCHMQHVKNGDKFSFGGKELTMSDDTIKHIKIPCIMKDISVFVKDQTQGYGSYMTSLANLRTALMPNTTKVPLYSVKIFMEALMGDIYSMTSGDRLVFSSSCTKPKYVTIKKSGGAQKPFTLNVKEGTPVVMNAETAAKESKEMMEGLGTQLTQGPTKRQRVIYDPRLGDVEADNVCATEENLASALPKIRELPNNIPKYLRAMYHTQNGQTFDDSASACAIHFNFAGLPEQSFFINPLWLTCLLVWFGHKCPMVSDLSRMIPKMLIKNNDEKQYRRTFCGVVQVLLSILATLHEKFLTADAAARFRVVVDASTQKDLSAIDDNVMHVMKKTFRHSMTGVNIIMSTRPTPRQAEDMIFAAFCKTRDPSMTPEETDRELAKFQNVTTRGEALEQAKTYLSEACMKFPAIRF